MRCKDQIFVITGANGGMGKAAVSRFLEEGAKVIAVDRTFDAKSDSEACLFVEADLTDEQQVKGIFAKVEEQYGKLDGLINLVGIAQAAAPITEVSLSQWEKIMAVNVTSLFLTSREALPLLEKNGGGSITNVASISAVRPRPGLQAYIASKGAAVAFSKALAIECAEKGIRVNVIHPGPADTSMLAQFTPANENPDDVKEETFRKSVPLGRLIQPEDIANAALYLSSNEARNVTGAVLHVDGGRGL
ncbi:MAG TPA: SDR family oxidoreductase [Bacillus sp. (in: firmicutes)]|uniref:SDR family NAD(P)-dependent oxidoreductase n=1 Tax=Bacillus litorisediminis TaxID=2922713 RepID=UPI001FAB463D|nr:SDR family oxidoreductase [Bacillus litorisediminis]HWO75618.1 SDR family oxidoreductase [Bacillus sp. (in: firmicutes)]